MTSLCICNSFSCMSGFGGWFCFVLLDLFFFFVTNSAKSLSVVRIQLKKMCHLADESMTIKADFSAEPDSKIDAEGFPRFWVFFFLDLGCSTSETEFS